jgi:hypothetical protein
MKDIMRDELGAPKIVDRSAFQAYLVLRSRLVCTELQKLLDDGQSGSNSNGRPSCRCGIKIIAASRTPPWLASGWGRRGRRLSKA